MIILRAILMVVLYTTVFVVGAIAADASFSAMGEQIAAAVIAIILTGLLAILHALSLSKRRSRKALVAARAEIGALRTSNEALQSKLDVGDPEEAETVKGFGIEGGIQLAAAQTRLDDFFEENLNQGRLVLVFCILMMLAGFGLLTWAILRWIQQQPPVTGFGSNLTAISGIVTEFLGATLMTLFYFFMNQRKDFVRQLAKLNAVSLAVAYVENMPDGQAELKSSQRSRVLDLVFSLADDPDRNEK